MKTILALGALWLAASAWAAEPLSLARFMQLAPTDTQAHTVRAWPVAYFVNCYPCPPDAQCKPCPSPVLLLADAPVLLTAAQAQKILGWQPIGEVRLSSQGAKPKRTTRYLAITTSTWPPDLPLGQAYFIRLAGKTLAGYGLSLAQLRPLPVQDGLTHTVRAYPVAIFENCGACPPGAQCEPCISPILLLADAPLKLTAEEAQKALGWQPPGAVRLRSQGGKPASDARYLAVSVGGCQDVIALSGAAHFMRMQYRMLEDGAPVAGTGWELMQAWPEETP